MCRILVDWSIDFMKPEINFMKPEINDKSTYLQAKVFCGKGGAGE